jgi:hypothetical protein
MRGPVMGGGGGFRRDILLFPLVPNFFPLCSHQVPKGFLKFPICSPKTELIAPHFNLILYDLPKVQLLSMHINWKCEGSKKRLLLIGGVPNTPTNWWWATWYTASYTFCVRFLIMFLVLETKKVPHVFHFDELYKQGSWGTLRNLWHDIRCPSEQNTAMQFYQK